MNASTAFSIETIIPTQKAEAFGKGLLLANGVILTGVAGFSALADLAGHYLGRGPFAMYEGNLDSIAFYEAHGLGLIVALLLVAYRNWPTARWHWIAAAMHTLLGGANLMFWPIFAEMNALPMGIAATAMHWTFVALQVVAALARTPSILSGPGAWFRASAAVTLVTGVALHLSSLPLGREVFQQSVLTPLVDTIFAVPMIIAGVAGVMLWRRAILPSLWEKLVYGFVIVVLLGSIVLHAKTAITWDTSYVLAFPAWYPLASFVYLSLLTVFCVSRRFTPAPVAAGRLK